MKILVATSNTQGTRENDFCFVPEEEIVRFGVECTKAEIDDNCGCRRSMVGINCGKSTTTVKVVETKLIKEEFRRLIRKSFRRSVSGIDSAMELTDLTNDTATVMADFIMLTAEAFNVGQVLERRGSGFFIREEVWADTIGD